MKSLEACSADEILLLDVRLQLEIGRLLALIRSTGALFQENTYDVEATLVQQLKEIRECPCRLCTGLTVHLGKVPHEPGIST